MMRTQEVFFGEALANEGVLDRSLLDLERGLRRDVPERLTLRSSLMIRTSP